MMLIRKNVILLNQCLNLNSNTQRLNGHRAVPKQRITKLSNKGLYQNRDSKSLLNSKSRRKNLTLIKLVQILSMPLIIHPAIKNWKIMNLFKNNNKKQLNKENILLKKKSLKRKAKKSSKEKAAL